MWYKKRKESFLLARKGGTLEPALAIIGLIGEEALRSFSKTEKVQKKEVTGGGLIWKGKNNPNVWLDYRQGIKEKGWNTIFGK